ncbi:uncharacterized protein LAESUDRAFT_648915 [Laetiporus sulphureus 93-53]|uniref:Uncharacterized protein n=1 Tax=Laetiporus sulphureus 93-53 TaxID=1314785 RepID=A0A165F3D7_9APHY|nr:uncharacterized protein LAESUDRAFT_648915 [Laetiporus sulphureus 93-53]KZT08295.1 hypothetical protein LAESUDRAFT_648915 [Laetiporus sulphureus 93-53]
MPIIAPHDIYAKELFQCRYGLPLWFPKPGRLGEVLIGDVGFLQGGAFIHLFNAARPADDEVNKVYGVPDDFEQFILVKWDINECTNAINAGPVCSKSATTAKVDAEVGASFHSSCVDCQGAFLLLKESMNQQQLFRSKSLFVYLLRNMPRWHVFARDVCDMVLVEEDILFVSRWVKTTE